MNLSLQLAVLKIWLISTNQFEIGFYLLRCMDMVFVPISKPVSVESPSPYEIHIQSYKRKCNSRVYHQTQAGVISIEANQRRYTRAKCTATLSYSVRILESCQHVCHLASFNSDVIHSIVALKESIQHFFVPTVVITVTFPAQLLRWVLNLGKSWVFTLVAMETLVYNVVPMPQP